MRPNLLAWVLGGAMLGATVATGLLVLSRLSSAAPQAPAPLLTVIPLPSATPQPSATPTGSPAPEASETPLPESGSPRGFSTGALVSISGTGGEGLRLREAPGLDAAVRLVALESEVFEVLEGPVAGDGYNWWRLTNPYDRSQQGWAADSFLRELDS